MNPNPLIIFSIPIIFVIIAVVKTANHWIPSLRALPRIQQISVIVILGYAVAVGGSKPGPTISNLKLLMAERASKKLSSGQSYGEKNDIVEAGVIANNAQGDVDLVANSLPVVEGTISDATDAIAGIEAAPRYYMRQRYDRPTLSITNNLYAEISHQSIDTNGVVMAYVWFSVIPNVQPDMRFVFSAGNVESVKAVVTSYECSFPDTFTINGYECILYAFRAPDYLLRDGKLSTPIDYEHEVSFGCEATSEPFDIRGGIVLDLDGDLYTGVTGFITNSITGQVLFFNDGFLANPPVNVQSPETPQNEEM